MIELKLKKEYQREQEFELKAINGGTQKSRSKTEKNIEKQVGQNYRSASKQQSSLNEPRKTWWNLQNQELKTTHLYLRTHCISKKSWLRLQRIILVLVALSLVLVTNIGTLIIYVKDVIPTTHLGSEKSFAMIKPVNTSIQNTITPTVQDYVPVMNAHNLSQSNAIDSKSSKVTNKLSFYVFPL